MMRSFILYAKTILVLSTFLIFQINTTISQNNYWQDADETRLSYSEADRPIYPLKYRTLSLNLTDLKEYLKTAPVAYYGNPVSQPIPIQLPMPDGSVEIFSIYNAPIMEEALLSLYPEIQTYCGFSQKNPGSTIRFSVTQFGFNAMILNSDNGTIFIDPYAKTTTDYYVSYYKKDYVRKTPVEWSCGVEDMVQPPKHLSSPEVDYRYGSCTLRRYRLALACTGEYANAVCPPLAVNTANTLAKMVISVNRVNALYEIDLAITMVLVANNSSIIYLNSSDPYTNNDGFTMLSENQTNLDNVIGSANYDIGHVFSTGGGGIASLQAPCDVSIKAGGVTGSPDPEGDAYDIDYVAHEMGHQFGANHTFANCSGNENPATTYEPGSGSTIMAYAGICSATQNVQTIGEEHSNIGIQGTAGASDVYFHAESLREIGVYVTNTAPNWGGSCPVTLGTGTAPTLPTIANYTIPVSTPFELPGSVASGTGAFWYCWEQMDNTQGTGTFTTPPSGAQNDGPNYRSYLPVTSTNRIIPKDANIGVNSNTWEVLPTVVRSDTFNYTVRAIQTIGGISTGCTANQKSIVTSCTGSSLAVTAPNTAVSWTGNTTQTVTWTTGCATCASVDIMVSTDGGATYTTVLAATANDGTQTITVPNTGTSTARVKVKCSSSIFFDVSNVTFTIIQQLPLDLLTFKTTPQKEQIALNWRTSNELNIKGFTIERSTNDSKDFEEIGWVNANGNSTINNYSYIDKNVVAGITYYYRLKVLEYSDETSFSTIEFAKIESTNQVVLLPNPANNYVNLYFDEPVENVLIEILDITGQQIASIHLNDNIINQYTLATNDLATGVYIVRVKIGNKESVQKLVIE
ncbi:MAG: zinc-dependent metalloprotease family protein [Saprospiraceae bacterium]